MKTIENNPVNLELAIQLRCSTRSFLKDIPPSEAVNKILQSGIYAPYANSTGLPYAEIRKVFVFRQDTDSMKLAREILCSKIKKFSGIMNVLLRMFPFLRKKLGPFAEKLNINSQKGIPALSDAPYFIVIAERKGFPSNQKQSIAHAMQNMWLTATSLGLGFQLIFMASVLSKDQQFLKLLGLRKGDYLLDGCVIGYPSEHSDIRKEFKTEEFVTWMS
jgi:nitroreductase